MALLVLSLIVLLGNWGAFAFDFEVGLDGAIHNSSHTIRRDETEQFVVDFQSFRYAFLVQVVSYLKDLYTFSSRPTILEEENLGIEIDSELESFPYVIGRARGVVVVMVREGDNSERSCCVVGAFCAVFGGWWSVKVENHRHIIFKLKQGNTFL